MKLLKSSMPVCGLMSGLLLLATGTLAQAQYVTETVYYESFSGLGLLNGTTPDECPSEEPWTALTNGTSWMADGTIEDSGLDRWAYLPFTPTAGKIYTLSLDVNPTSGGSSRLGGSNWFGMGFLSGQRLDDVNPFFNAAPWMLQRVNRNLTNEINTFLKGTSGVLKYGHDINGFVPLTIVLNTESTDWTAEWFVDGLSIAGPIAYTGNPTINFIGFGRDETAGGVVDNFTLTVSSLDTDEDGVADDEDEFPNDPNEWVDTDGDGYGDNGDAFPNDPNEWADVDGDGYGDNSDVFPDNPFEWADTDGDGVGDNQDVFPEDPLESADADGDGVGDNTDLCPNSILTPTIVINGCDSGVSNSIDEYGCTLADIVAASYASAKNHGAFVSSIAKLAESFVNSGEITVEDKSELIRCAAKSDIGKKAKN